ncbi:hypothetical protein ACHQM5_028008 [Ranunculus cassubicifolius]
MANCIHGGLILLMVLLIQAIVINGFSSSNSQPCNGSIAECNEEEEMIMDSEINKEILLQTHKHIAPGTLRRDSAGCFRTASGQPYNCLSKPVNTQHKGCFAFQNCRQGKTHA